MKTAIPRRGMDFRYGQMALNLKGFGFKIKRKGLEGSF